MQPEPGVSEAIIRAFGIGPMEAAVLAVLGLAGLLAMLLTAWLVYRMLQGKRDRLPMAELVLTIDLASLDNAGPIPQAPQLECYNIPVRLAVLVVAPVGRENESLPTDKLPELLEQILPGLGQVAMIHGTLIQSWPVQLSPRGFAHIFFTNVQLPGDHGKGSHWCSVAGKAEVPGQSVMLGLAMRAAAPNSLGQFIVGRSGQWLDILRVRS